MNIDNGLGNDKHSGICGVSGVEREIDSLIDTHIISTSCCTTPTPHTPVASNDSDYHNRKEIIKYEKSLRSARMMVDFGIRKREHGSIIFNYLRSNLIH